MDDLNRVHCEIRKTFPKIAGVANGTLVLRDTVLANMKLETFQIVARPKVEGTINLDKLFSEERLDFFIPFSSLVATTGNIGQIAYSAGNCFAKAIVAQRRKRGLAGSTIDFSRVLGVGYVERESRAQGRLTAAQTERLNTRSAAINMAESDLHQLFAEAVLAGQPSSGLNPEVIAGLRSLTSEEAAVALWGSNVKFSHFIRELRDVGVDKDSSKPANISVKIQLSSARNMDDLFKVLRSKSMSMSSYQRKPLKAMGITSTYTVF
jgi:hypothetical protein